MPIVTDCPSCGHHIEKIPDDYAGMAAKCPKCKEKFTIPEQTPEISFEDLGIETEREEPRGRTLNRKPPKQVAASFSASADPLAQFERVAQNVQGSGNAVFFIAFLLALTPWMQIKTSSQEGQATVVTLAIIGGLVCGFVCSAMYRAAATIIRLLIIIARNGNGR